MPLSSKSLEHEYLLNLTFTIQVTNFWGGNPLELMPGRISAFKIREIDGIDAQSNLCIGIDARSN